MVDINVYTLPPSKYTQKCTHWVSQCRWKVGGHMCPLNIPYKRIIYFCVNLQWLCILHLSLPHWVAAAMSSLTFYMWLRVAADGVTIVSYPAHTSLHKLVMSWVRGYRCEQHDLVPWMWYAPNKKLVFSNSGALINQILQYCVKGWWNWGEGSYGEYSPQI